MRCPVVGEDSKAGRQTAPPRRVTLLLCAPPLSEVLDPVWTRPVTRFRRAWSAFTTGVDGTSNSHEQLALKLMLHRSLPFSSHPY